MNATENPDTTPANDGLDSFNTFMSETQALAVPDFAKMKKGDLQKFIQEGVSKGTIEEDVATPLVLKKVAEIRKALKSLFPAEGDLTSPEVTGFDPNDLIHQTVADMAKITEESVAVETILGLQDAAEFNFFQIGGVMSRIRDAGWMGEYETFGDFTVGTFAIQQRKAETLAQIYEALVGCGATWKEAKPIGWAKLAVVASCLTPENYKEWFATAKTSTQAGLVGIVKDAKYKAKANGTATTPDPTSTAVKKKTFSLHEDQFSNVDLALEKAKEMAGTEHDNVALDAMATEFLGGGDTKVAAPTTHSEEDDEGVDPEEALKELFTALEEEETLNLNDVLTLINTAFIDVFPSVEIEFTLHDGDGVDTPEDDENEED